MQLVGAGTDSLEKILYFGYQVTIMTMTPKDIINNHRQKGEWNEIIPLAQSILSRDPGDLAALRSLAEANEKIGREDQAMQIWRTLVDRHHEINPYATRLGIALKKQKDPEAVKYLYQALIVAIDRRHLAEVEEIWLELVDTGAVRATDFISYAQRLASRKEKERAGELLLIYVESSEPPPLDNLSCLRLIIEYLPDRQDSFRQVLLEAYRKVFNDRPDLEKLIDLANIKAGDSLFAAMQNLDRYLKFGEGQFFYHNGWGAGKVKRVEPAQQRVVIDFARKKDHMLTLEMADKSLAPIPANDLRAMLLESEDELNRMVTDDPIGLVKSALVSLGNKTNAKDLKDALLGKPVTEAQWPKWWSDVSKRLKDDHYIEVTGGALKTYTLRENAEGPDQEYARRFRECRTLRGRLDILDNFRKHLGTSCDPKILGQMAHDLVSKASQTHSDNEAVEAAFTVRDLLQQKSVEVNETHLNQIIDPILLDLDRAVNALEKMRNVNLQQRWFCLMEERLGDQLGEAYERLLVDGPDSLRDLVSEHVAKSHEENVIIDQFRNKVRPQFRDKAGLFIWFSRRLLADSAMAEQAGISRPTLIEHLVGLHEVLNYRSRTSKKDSSQVLRAQMSDIRQILKRANFKRLREIMTETDITTARQLWKTVEGAVGLEDRIRKEITGYLIAHFSDLSQPTQEDETSQPTTPLPLRLLCLEQTFLDKQAELKRLQEEDIPHTRNEVESARALGDLRENAEYHAAKERLAQLHSLMNQLQLDIASASSIRQEKFASDSALFGAQVRIQIGDSERIVVLLGPWESNPDKDILSYESPLGQILWGRKTGDTFTFNMGNDSTTIAILEIAAWNCD